MATLVEAAAHGATVLGAPALGEVALGAMALRAPVHGAAAFGVGELIVYLCLSRVVGRRMARAYGCHFLEFPHSQQQALQLYEQLQEFNCQRITNWTQIKKNKNTLRLRE